MSSKWEPTEALDAHREVTECQIFSKQIKWTPNTWCNKYGLGHMGARGVVASWKFGGPWTVLHDWGFRDNQGCF